ncbi:disease resistance protein [Dorcoceras hygrometricum]|uniref:Disease resistance protein n=1 Tax=Dorcoceras hygrometricum TaxID=472368 RepID=A0A2Z7A731_9LAMI|nr:disease resistance protein [Dorcoceras hygrometricum]
MEAVSAVIGAVLAEPSKIICNSIHARIRNFRNRESNFKDLEGETNILIQLKDRVLKKLVVQEQTERDRLQGQVDIWVNQVKELEEQVKAMKSSVPSSGGDATDYDLRCSCSVFPKLCRLSNQLVKMMERVKLLKEAGKSHEGQMSVPEQLIPVEHVPGATITGQKTASINLTIVLDKLKDDKVRAIGVYGMGGVGKTTLVSNLNNKLKQEPSANSFSIVIWVTVSKDTNNRKIQTRIFERLELEIRNEESDERVTSRLHERLKNEECFLLILDDVWADIDLQKLGIPNAEDCPRSKIIITSRSAEVCRQMSTEDAIIMVRALDDEEAWELFQKHSGEVAMRPEIGAVAEDVAKECAGLPLALVTVGASMKGKSDVRLWENAHTILRMSAPDLKGISVEEKVFKPLKWSYDSLPDDITRSCFLFCCLYPEDFEISVEELVQYWYCEGLFHERLNYEESENQGIAIIQCLTDRCLLENVRFNDRIKVHDVVRDVGIWIANSNGSQCRSLVRSGIQLTRITNEEFSHSNYKWVSFMDNKITELPAVSCVQCSEISTLLLKRNDALKIIPTSFLEGFKSLKILDLSHTSIESLPSLDRVNQLRALILIGCIYLEKLPALDGLSGLRVLDCRDAPITRFPYAGISRLHKLEYLDLWLDEETPLDGHRIFEEVLPLLEHLTVFYARLDCCPDIGNEQLNLLERIKHFCVKTRRSVIDVKWDNYVHFSRLRWPIELIERSLRRAPRWEFSECTNVLAQMLKTLARSGCFLSVKFLRISYGAFHLMDDQSIGATFDLLPNLEEIELNRVSKLKSVSDLGHIFGMSFSKLKSIKIEVCPQLKCVFTLKENDKLEKLQVMDVSFCEELECPFQDMDMGHVPNLQKVTLVDLPVLRDRCINYMESWENLKLEVIDCGKNSMFYDQLIEMSP